MASAEESNLALLLEKQDLEAALRKWTPEEESENEKKLAEYRAKIADCWKQLSELGNATDAFFIFLRVFGRQMHQTAVACLSGKCSNSSTAVFRSSLLCRGDGRRTEEHARDNGCGGDWVQGGSPWP